MRCLLVLLLAGVATADSWMPYGERLATSENGKHYLITRQLFRPKIGTAFELCVRKPGTAGPRKVKDKVVRGVDDRVVASGALKDPPLDVWVLNKKPAAILFERYASIGWDISLARLDGDGRIRWALKYSDLDLRGAKVTHSVSSKWWNAGWWVEEDKGRVVLVANGGVVNLVDLETGKLTRGDQSALLDAMRSPSAAVRWIAFALCPKHVTAKGWKERARAAMKNKKLPASTRFAAALALYRAEEAEPETALFHAVVGDHVYGLEAVRHAVDILGEDAVPVLEEYAQRFPDAAPIYELSQLKAAGAAALVRLATRTPGLNKMRVRAAIALGRFAPGEFARAVRQDAWLARAVLKKIGNERLIDAALAKLLREPGEGDEVIAAHLARKPMFAYVEPLRAALKRNPKSDVIATALRACEE